MFLLIGLFNIGGNIEILFNYRHYNECDLYNMYDLLLFILKKIGNSISFLDKTSDKMSK